MEGGGGLKVRMLLNMLESRAFEGKGNNEVIGRRRLGTRTGTAQRIKFKGNTRGGSRINKRIFDRG